MTNLLATKLPSGTDISRLHPRAHNKQVRNEKQPRETVDLTMNSGRSSKFLVWV